MAHCLIDRGCMRGIYGAEVGIVDHRDGDDLVIHDLDAGQMALRSTVGARDRRTADAYDGEQACD